MSKPVINERVFDHEEILKLLIENNEIYRVMMDRLFSRLAFIESKLGIEIDAYGKPKDD